ncbi:hypothetical protein [Fervidibacter sacchari]
MRIGLPLNFSNLDIALSVCYHESTQKRKRREHQCGERLSLSVTLCWLIGFERTNASQPPYPPYPPYPPQHQHNWTEGAPIPKPIVVLFYPGTSYTATHLRCYEIASLADVASATDWDQCVAPGCPFPNGWAADRKVKVRWSDNGAGGQFGTLDSNGNFVPLDPVLNAEQITHYRASWDRPGIVHITLEVDDAGLYYDDEPVVNDPDSGNVTVWEFWITNHTPKGWRPQLSDTLSFSAHIRPIVDHNGNSLAGHITFHLNASSEPSFCLNICCLGYEECQKWVVRTDEQGQERLERKCELFPYCAWDIGLFWGMPECEWHKFLLENGLAWMATTVWDSDLKFPPDQAGFWVDYPYCTQATTLQPVTDATVEVMCLDYGAFGTLTATCSHPILGEIQARLPFGVWDDASSWLSLPFDYDVGIPYDYDLDGIADVWQDRHGEQYAGDVLADADDTPVGDGTEGDGLSAYEEYRGMVVRGVWKEFDPKIKDMFVMNFGAVPPPNDPKYLNWPFDFIIPNEAITSDIGFPGTGVPGENGKGFWLLNANEGSTRLMRHPQGWIPGKIVNFLCGYAHLRDVYAAVIVPSEDDRPEFAWALGPIWNVFSAPVIEILLPAVRDEVNYWNGIGYQYDLLHALACVIAHELGHTILWHIDHNEQVQDGEDEISILTNGDKGHHVYGQHRMRCFMWPYFPPGVVPDLDNDGAWDSLPFPNLPTDFCDSDPGCQNLWRLNP